MKKFFQAILPLVLIVFAISLLAVGLNNFIVTFPLARKTVTAVNNLGELTVETAEVVKNNSGEVYMLNGDIENLYNDLNNQLDLTKDIYNYFQNAQVLQAEVNKAVYMLLVEQTKHIEFLEKKVETLERRHLEVIRAISILQKKHWKEIEE